MIDRDYIIKGIEECDLNGGLIGNCPYKEILTLLIEQERKPVIVCPHCGRRVDDNNLSDVYRKRVKDKLSSFYGIREDENNG